MPDHNSSGLQGEAPVMNSKRSSGTHECHPIVPELISSVLTLPEGLEVVLKGLEPLAHILESEESLLQLPLQPL